MNTLPGAGPDTPCEGTPREDTPRAGYCHCVPERRKLFIPTAAPAWCMACGSDIDPHENADPEPETGRVAVLPPEPDTPEGDLP